VPGSDDVPHDDAMLEQLLTKARKHRHGRPLPPPGVRRSLRVGSGLSQAEIAIALRVTRPTVSRWESGKREPRGRHHRDYQHLLDKLAALVATES
jgi:DNA-binding transcriptional regulator YiaG